MKNLSGSDIAKKNAAEKACGMIMSGMAVGLGTGSTAAHAIRYLGGKIKDEGLKIKCVTTSFSTEALAVEYAIPLTSLAETPVLDIAIDGADQVDKHLNAIKGGGAAHTREKVVACSAKVFVIMADDKKMVDTLNRPVPIEVLPYAVSLVKRDVEKLGGKPAIRTGTGKDGPTISDNGNIIMDCDFGEINDPAALGDKLSRIPGLVEHGIFTNASFVYVGYEDRVEVRTRK